MRNLTKIVLAAASLLGTAVIANTTASAQDAAAAAPAPTWALTGAIAGQSDYRFRGISQSNRDPVPQGTLNLTGPDGFYVGTWASKINWQANGINDNPGVEWDVYGGKHWDMGDGTDFNTEAYGYLYPDAQGFSPNTASYFEGIFTLSHTWGPLAADVVYAISPQFSAGTGVGNYVEGQATYTLTDWLTVSANLGHQWVEKAAQFGSRDYTHADIGLTATWKSLSFDARYTGTDLNSAQCGFYMGTKHACNPGFMGTITYNMNLLP
jgi:uncharacterized protein (TIGR02001 family)